MNRLLVSLLAAFDAVIAVAAGIAVVVAPLTVVWVIGFGGAADWGALWPTAATVWQLGHLVPLAITLPGEYLAATGLSEDAASFVLSLAPLAFAAFTAIFAARSGMRSSRANAWITGVISATVVFGIITAAIALTSGNGVAQPQQWQAILFPTLVFTLPALAGAIVTEWTEAPSGVIVRLRERAARWPHRWGDVPGLVLRGAAVVIVGLVGLGALGFAVALAFGGAEVIALFEAGHMDALGATVTTLGQLAYLPTLVVWAFSYIVGPGFAVGIGTTVSPGGTQLGVVPGIPVLGAIPSIASSWLLLLVLLPIALGAFAGWIVRSRLVAANSLVMDAAMQEPARPVPAWATPSLEGVLGTPLIEDEPSGNAVVEEPIAVRLTITAGIAVIAAAAAALLALIAGGSIGPGALEEVGPSPGPVALAVGLEVLLGASILILAPRRRGDTRRERLKRGDQNAPDEAIHSAGGSRPSTVDSEARDVDDADDLGAAGDAHVADDAYDAYDAYDLDTDAHDADDTADADDPGNDADDTAELPPLIPRAPGTVPEGPTPRRPGTLPR